MERLWRALKVVLSAVLLAVMCLFLYLFAHHPDKFMLLGWAGAFLFMAALLWANLKPTSREFGLVGVVLALGFLFVGLQTLTGAHHFPRECSGKRILCDFENVLYAVGGPTLAAAPSLVLGIVLLYASARLVVLRSISR